MLQPATFIFFGKSGSGKGTQAHLIQKMLEEQGRSVLYIETGKELRAFTESHAGYSAERTREIMNNGDFLPGFMPIWVWANRLVQDGNQSQDLILDGLARKFSEAPILDSALKFYGRQNVYIVHINVSRQWSLDRLIARQRVDDTVERIDRRLAAFEHEVPMVLDYFREKKGYGYIEVNGERSIEEVHADILAGIQSVSFVC